MKRPRVVQVVPRTRRVIGMYVYAAGSFVRIFVKLTPATLVFSESEGSTVQRPQWTSTSYAVEPGQTRTRKAILPRRVVRMGTPPSPPSDGPRYFPRTPLPDGSIDVEAASAAVAAVTVNNDDPPSSPPLGPITVRPIVIAPIDDETKKNDESLPPR